MSYWQSNYQGEPMDIDATTIDKSNAKCFNCGKTGHFIHDCRLPKKQGQHTQTQGSSSSGQRHQQNKGKGKQKQGQGRPQHNNKKRMNPTQFKTHLRALIEENFGDEGSPEYDEFLESIQEGF